MDPELIKKIKILAAQLEKRQNDLIEKAIKEFLEKYEHIVPSQRLSDNIWGRVLNIFIYIGFSAFFLGWLALLSFSLASILTPLS